MIHQRAARSGSHQPASRAWQRMRVGKQEAAAWAMAEAAAAGSERCPPTD